MLVKYFLYVNFIYCTQKWYGFWSLLSFRDRNATMLWFCSLRFDRTLFELRFSYGFVVVVAKNVTVSFAHIEIYYAFGLHLFFLESGTVHEIYMSIIVYDHHNNNRLKFFFTAGRFAIMCDIRFDVMYVWCMCACLSICVSVPKH